MNSKLKLALVAASAAGAAASLIGQIPAALAGPTLSGTSTQNFGAGAAFNLQSAQSFEAVGATSATIAPFAPSAFTAAGTTSGFTGTPIAGLLNAGTSTLTAAFDRNGFDNTGSSNTTLATPSFAVQAGIIPLGGNFPTAGITTATTDSSGTNIKTNLALGIVLNQNAASGVPAITIAGSGGTSIIGASITSQSVGASQTTGTFSDSLTVINSLSAF